LSRAKISRETLKEGRKEFSAIRLKAGNATILLLSEDGDNLGTLAVAVPQRKGMLGPPLSSVLIGQRHSTTARILAERLAGLTGKLSLVSIYSKTLPEKEGSKIFLKLFRKIMEAEEREI